MWMYRFVNGGVMCSFFFLLLQHKVFYQAEIVLSQALGCFRERPLCQEKKCFIFPSDNSVENITTYDVSTCGSTCRSHNFSFFGVEGTAGQCYCGYNVPRLFGQVPLLLCVQLCKNDATYSTEDLFRCGGKGVISVYRSCAIGKYGTDCGLDCNCPARGPCKMDRVCYSSLCEAGWKSAYQSSSAHCSVRDCSFVNGDCLTECLAMNDSATPGCTCLQGYKEVGGVRCEDVNECDGSGQNCTTCVNKVGSSLCTCDVGFTVSWLAGATSDTPICIDLDECSRASSCDVFNCSNTFGSYRCVCPQGYAALSKVTHCEDIDECSQLRNSCPSCRNTPGSYTCSCGVGFNWINSKCEDVDECATGQHNCQQQSCINANGTFICIAKSSVPASLSQGCSLTGVLLSGGATDYDYSYPYRRSDSLLFKATVRSSCQIIEPLQFLWKITSKNSLAAIAPIVEKTLQVNYYIFNPASAEFGKYVTEITVMKPGSTVGRFDKVSNKTYFQLVRTELNAILLGGSAVSVDIKETVKLDASLSVDPDPEASGTSDLHYAWYCVQGKETLPMVDYRVHSDVFGCYGSWLAPRLNQQTVYGFPTALINLIDCKQFCVFDDNCARIYIDETSTATSYCWVQTENSPETVLQNVTIYELNKRLACNHNIKIYTNSTVPCQATWSPSIVNKHVAGAIPTHDQTFYECQRHCILDIACTGIDLRFIRGSPYCWLMVGQGTILPLGNSIHFDLLNRTPSCSDTTSVTPSDCFANEHVQLSENGKILEFPATSLLNYNLVEHFTFTVVISKPNFLKQSMSQTVFLINEKPTINVNLNCVLNCGRFMIPSFSLVLKANCLRCLEQSYLWSIGVTYRSKGRVRYMVSEHTDGGLNSAVLNVNPYVFKSDSNDFYIITLDVTYENQVMRRTSYAFETTTSPTVDHCYINPNVGFGLKTDFAISCIGGLGNFPLLYTFTLRRCSGGADISIIYQDSEPIVRNLKLPIGDPDLSYMVCVSATIADRYSVKISVELRATVSPGTFTLADLEEMTRNASRLKAQGDISGSTYLFDLLAFTTNEFTKKNLLNSPVEDMKKFRQFLVGAISSVAGGSTSQDSIILQQSVTALRKATNNPIEIDASGITKTINLKKISDNIGNSGETLPLEVRGIYFQETYKQLFQVGSNLMASAQNAAKDERKNGKNVVNSVMDVLDSASKKLESSTFLNGKTSIKTDVFTASVSAVQPSATRRTTVANDDFSVSLPPELFAGVPDEESNEFKISMITFKENPFWWADAGDRITSGCAKVIVRRKDVVQEAPKAMKSTIAVSLPMNATVKLINETMGIIYPENVAFFDVNIYPSGGTGAVLKMIMSGNFTQLDDGTVTFTFCRGKRSDVRARLAVNNYCDCNTLWTAELNKTRLPTSMTAKLEVDMISELGNFLVVEYANSQNVSIDITLKASQIYCRFWDAESSTWDQTGCVPDVDNSTMDLIVCNCNHLSSFAGSFIVRPNSIDIMRSLNMFLMPWKNPVGLILVSVVWLLFVLALLWARRKDKYDALKALPIDLEDNSVNARYVYLVTVFTGSRYGSGTTSDVFICLIGDVGTSAAHWLKCQEYKVLQCGHVNLFILRTVASLGKLRAIRFWHYNSGKNPHWYVSRVIVHDPQSAVTSHFLCQSWLALNKENGGLDRTFLIATPKEVVAFQHLFFINTLRGLNDKHIWISVLRRPTLSTFSRMQRVACCMSLILGYLLTNMMFFNVQVTEEQKNMKVGVFTLNWAQVAIAIESALVMFPVTVLTGAMFRNMKPPPQEYKLLRQWEKAVDAKSNKFNTPTPESSSVPVRPSTDKRYPKETSGLYTPKSTDSSKPESSSTNSSLFKLKQPRSGNSSSNSIYTSKSSKSSESETSSVHSELSGTDVVYSEGNDDMVTAHSSSNSETTKTDRNLTDEVDFQSVIEGDEKQKKLPWWTVYIAWTLVVCVSAVFTFFIILYTFEFGLPKSIDWLKAVLLSFFTGILIQEPLKVIATAIIIAVLFKRSEDIEITNSDSITEDTVRGLQAADNRHLVHFNEIRMNPHYHPPTHKSVINARDVLVRQFAMYKIIWEIIRYFVFIVLALIITNIRRDYSIFLLNSSYKRYLFDQPLYKKIVMREDFWNWTRTCWMNFIYADDDDLAATLDLNSNATNGSEILGLMGNGLSVLMRSPRFVKFPKGTDYPLQFLYSDHSGTEDTVNLGMTRRAAEAAIMSLIRTNWINRSIGGAILEAVSYTACADLMSILSVVLEVPSTGGISVYNTYHTLKFNQYLETFQLISFVLEIVYFGFTLWFIIHVIRQMSQLGRKKYFGSFWNWLDFAIVLMSVSLIVVYVLLNVLLFDSVKTYAKTRELQFTYVSMLDILLNALLGFVSVLGIIKCLQLLRFSPLINGLNTVLSRAASYTVAFLFYSFYLFLVFVSLLHLLFFSDVGGFKSIGSSLMTLVLAVSKHYNYSEVYTYSRLWGPLLILSCVLIFHIIVINMAFAIISAALRELKTLPQLARDAEFIQVLMDRLFGWFHYEDRQERQMAKKAKVVIEPSDETVSRSGF